MPMTLLEELDTRLYRIQEYSKLINGRNVSLVKIAELHARMSVEIDECVGIREIIRAEEAESAEKGRAHAA